MSFKEVSVKDLNFNPVTMISDEWMLITAGTKERGFNTMTASWGHIGAIWGHGSGRPTAVVYLRPQRYTKEFMDREEYYTLSFFSGGYKKALGYLGSHSGRDGDKVSAAGLTPESDDKCAWFKEAELVFVCRKLYRAPILEEGFIDRSLIEENYPQKDFHDMYIGEIVKVLQKE